MAEKAQKEGNKICSGKLRRGGKFKDEYLGAGDK